MSNDSQFIIRIPKVLKKNVMRIANKKGHVISKLVRNFLQDYEKENKDLLD